MDFQNKNYIYLDFETDTKGEFFIAGIKQNGAFKQITLNPGLSGLASEHEMDLQTPSSFAKSLLQSADSHSVIVAYSIPERDLLRDLVTDGAKLYPDLKYLNLLRVAKRWVRDYRQDDFNLLPPFRKDPKRWGAKRLPNSLASIMRLTDFPAPFDYAPGKTSTKFKTVKSALEKKNQTYELLTSKQKKKATESLKHNKFDVDALEVLLMEIIKTDSSLLKPQIKPLFC